MWEKAGWEDMREEHRNMAHLPYVKEITSANSKHEAGPPKLVLWDNPGGWVGRRWEGAQEGGLIHVDI